MSDDIHQFDIRTNAEWQRLGAIAENRPTIKVNQAEVPECFHHLISHVERWAIGCDVIRGDYFDKQPQTDMTAFYQAVRYKMNNPTWSSLIVKNSFSNSLIDDISSSTHLDKETLSILRIDIFSKKDLSVIKKVAISIRKILPQKLKEEFDEELSEISEDFQWKASDRGKYILEINDWVQTFHAEFRSIPEFEKVVIGGHSEHYVVFDTGKLKDPKDQERLLEYIESKQPPYKILLKLL